MSHDVSIPDVHSYHQILSRAGEKAASQPVRAALVSSGRPESLRALAQAADSGLVSPTVVGNETDLRAVMKREEIDLSDARMIPTGEISVAAEAAVDLVSRGETDLLVVDEVSADSLPPLLADGAGDLIEMGRLVSHVAVLGSAKYVKLMLLTDGMIHPAPDVKTKIGLIGNLVTVAKAIDLGRPRVAVLAAVEVVYPQMAATLDGAVLAKMAERGQIKGAYVDGPLSFDVAIDMDAAHAKGIMSSDVAGQADAFLAPTVEVASGVYQAMTLFGGCDAGAVLVGAKVPVAMAHRTDSVQNRLNALALGVLLAH